MHPLPLLFDQVTHKKTSSHTSAEMPGKLLGLGGPKTELKITLDSARKYYTTLDRIEGCVSITPSVDLSFDEVDIEFVGTSRTYVERLTTAAAVSGRTQAFHQFLRLSQPGNAAYYPEDLVLRAGESYTFPFVFAVPEQLLPRICSHPVHNEAVREAHFRLPPSLGDCELQHRGDQLDDLAPDMASVRYGVYAKISKLKPEGDEMRRVTLVAKARKVRILPAVEEQPPLSVEDDSKDFNLRKEKKIKKGLFKGKLGTLVMETQQPSSFRLPSPDAEPDERITTMATILLRFDPSEKNAQPPRLNTLHSKLKAATFFASTARRDFPSRNDTLSEMNVGQHTVNLDLSSRCMANVDWTRQDTPSSTPSSPLATPARRTSSTVSGPLVPPDPSSSYKGGAFWVARILVPIELPSNKSFVPTFHSCIISRTYSLTLSLSTHSGIGPNLDLRVPIQVSSSPSAASYSPRPSVATMHTVDLSDQVHGQDVNDFFEPRTIYAPEAEYVGGSSLRGSIADATTHRRDSFVTPPGTESGLPEYSVLAPGARGRRPGIPAY